MPMNIYEENRILNATPIELVRILYIAAIRSVENARESLRAGQIAARSREISKAQAILIELASSIDPTQGPEISERLLALYDYMQARLAEANSQQQDTPLAEVRSLLGTLEEAWSQCAAGHLEPALR